MTPEQIARVCHEVNRAYCEAIGDRSQLPWEAAPEWQRNSAINGVAHKIGNPNATPEDMHQSWLNQKHAEGWSWGMVKDPAKKEHPCMVSYGDLPVEQRVKDHLFSAVVMAIASIPKASP